MPTLNRELLNSLNNTFVNDDKITEMIHYLKEGEFPTTVDIAQKQKMYVKKATQYNVDGDYLVFIPLNLKVIPKSKTQEVQDEIYADAGIGKGVVALYKYVRRHYMNITWKEVASFIQNQTNYQLTRDTRHRVNKPIISYYPNSLWCVDLIDMSSLKRRIPIIVTS